MDILDLLDNGVIVIPEPKNARDILKLFYKEQREFREMKLFKKEGTYLDVVQKYMISLKEAGLEMFPEYTDEEKKNINTTKIKVIL
jgi:hypothetical protein